ncbi:hypothetical protein QFZ81_007281 [Paenibacillus sp. V4I9]|nr:hypothetical protein [Paenibacillus sp. V4I9]
MLNSMKSFFSCRLLRRQVVQRTTISLIFSKEAYGDLLGTLKVTL